MNHLGRVKPGSTIEFCFGSFAGSTGAPSATTGSSAGDIQIFKDGGTTQRASSSGVTFTVDFDSLTGFNYVSIDLSDNTTADFYAAGSRYTVVISDVTIDGQTVRFPLGSFRIGIESAILDTTIASLSSQTSFTLTAGSADDNAYVGCVAYIHDAASAVQCAIGIVSAYTGSTKTITLAADPGIFTMAAKDNISLLLPNLLVNGTSAGRVKIASGYLAMTWADIASPTTTVNLSGTTVKTATDVETDTQDIQSRLPAALVSGRIDASVGAMSSGVLTATAIASDAITDAKVASDVTIASVTGAVGSVTGNVGGNVVGSVGSVTGLTASDVGAIKTKTDFLPSATAGSAGGVFIAGTNAATTVTTSFTTTFTGNLTGNVGGNVTGSIGSLATQAKADVNAEADTAISDAALATASNLATVAGYIDTEVTSIKDVTDKLMTLLEPASGSPGDYRFSADALYRAPSGGGGGGGASVSDIWSAAVPGAYSAGSAGYLLGTYLNATVSSRAAASVLGAAVGASISADIAAVKTQTAAIETDTQDIQSRLPAALVNGQMDSTNSDTVVRATVGTGSTTTSIITSAFAPAGAAADQFKGRIVIFDNDTATAALRGQATDITASSNASTPTLTVTALTTAPSSGDTFSVL